MKEETCWWCENGFDEVPLNGQEKVMVNGEPMHACCKTAYERGVKIDAQVNQE